MRVSIIRCVLLAGLCVTSLHAKAAPETEVELYLKKRAELMQLDQNEMLGSDLQLTPDELKLNDHLKQLKADIWKASEKPPILLPSDYFYDTKPTIDNSPLFTLLRAMPKGGVLHLHFSVAGNIDWVIEHAGSMPDLYVNWQADGPAKGTLYFYKPDQVPAGFKPIAELRAQIPNFDRQLRELLVLSKNSRGETAQLWEEFETCLTRLRGVLTYAPFCAEYCKNIFNGLIDDGVQYVELRTSFSKLYDLTGGTYETKDYLRLLTEAQDEVRKRDPSFTCRVIQTDYRFKNKQEQEAFFEKVCRLRAQYPNWIVGYDIVGEEDTSYQNIHYLQTLLKNCPPSEGPIPYYFHSGESLYPGNLNLYDAVLLKAHRIGHALNLFYFPHLMDLVEKEQICLEICPISNQLLGYVSDFREHPASGYLRRGLPCVLSTDDPMVFDYSGVSYDFWVAAVSWDLDLRTLKALCYNSLQWSGMTEEDRQAALREWDSRWAKFVNRIIINNK